VRVRIKIKLYTQAQFTSAFIVLTDVWLFLNILNYTNTTQMRGGLHQDSYCVLWGWHLTASRFEGRVPNRFFGIRDFRYLKPGIRDLKEKSGRVSRLKVCTGGGMPKITLGITGLHEILGRDYGIEEPYWGPSVSMVGLWTDGHSHETRLSKKGLLLILHIQNSTNLPMPA